MNMKILVKSILLLCFIFSGQLLAQNETKSTSAITSIFSLLLLDDDEAEIESVFFNYDPNSEKFATVALSNDAVFNIMADKSGDTALVTEVSMVVGDDWTNSVRMFFDSEERVSKILSIYGEGVFEYLGNGRIRVTATDSNGNSESTEIDDFYAKAKSHKILDESPPPISNTETSLQSCGLLNDSNFWMTNVGTVTFACDNVSIEDADYDVFQDKYFPRSLRFSYSGRNPKTQERVPLSQVDEVFIAGYGPVTIDPNNIGTPGTEFLLSSNFYNYEISIPSANPEFSQWKNCCELAYNTGFKRIVLALNSVGFASSVGSGCLAGNTVLPGLGCIIGGVTGAFTDFVISTLYEKIVIDTTREGIIKTCALEAYNAHMESEFNQESYRTATLEFEKSNVRNGLATFTAYDVDLTKNDIDPIVIGPAPAYFRPTSSPTLSGDGIYAFRETGERLVFAPNGVSLQFNEANELIPVVIAPGETIRFQAIDQFQNQEAGLSQFESQFYSCANYRWFLIKDGNRIDAVTVRSTEGGFQTPVLEPGDYKAKVCVSNTELQGSVSSAEARFTGNDGRPASRLGHASGRDSSCAEVDFEIKELDQCAIERYKLRIGEFTNDPQDSPLIATLNPGDPFAAENGQWLYAALTRDGEDIPSSGVFQEIIRFPTVDRSNADVEVDFSFAINDPVNSCDISFPIDLTVKNTAYRTLVGKTFNYMVQSLGPFSVTFEEDGTMSGDNDGNYSFFSSVTQGYEACDGSGPTKAVGVIDAVGLDIRTRISIGVDGTLTPLGCRLDFLD